MNTIISFPTLNDAQIQLESQLDPYDQPEILTQAEVEYQDQTTGHLLESMINFLQFGTRQQLLDLVELACQAEV